MNFTDFKLSPEILKAIDDKGYKIPSPIQAEAIPPILEKRDVMAAAQTGTGKTAGFTLPILQNIFNGNRVQHNQARVLILTPTRELAAQIEESVKNYGKYLNISSTVVFGGVKINPQMQKLRRGVDILVATPGRLLDLYSQNAIRFPNLEILVLDEADRMLDMGFIHDIKKILKLLPKKRQTLMFSATFSEKIRNLAKGLIDNPVEISVTPRNTAAETVEQVVYPVDKKQKSALLTQLIKKGKWEQVLVFCRTKHGANRLTKHLISKKLTAAAIHGNKSQGARTRALAEFKSGEIKILVATDIAARGLDISQLPQVVNFDLPNIPEDYIHRIGRTGRAGLTGHAVSLVCSDEFRELSEIERLLNLILPREILDGFDPVHTLPASNLSLRVPKIKKPKRPKSDHRDGRRFESKKPKTEKKAEPRSYTAKRAKGNSSNDSNQNDNNSQGSTSKPSRYKPRTKSSNRKGRRY